MLRSTQAGMALLLLGGCRSPAAQVSSTTGITSVAEDPGSASSSGSAGSSSTGDDTVSGAASGEDETTGSAPDLGVAPDFGDGAPVGCKGKIDFLFMISRDANMWAHQEQLAKAFPQFIATIESKFADFDYHIMVVDGDDTWGVQHCTDACPDALACKIGDPCCPVSDPDYHGLPCCGLEYPCADLDLVDPECDYAWGAGTTFPAGGYSSNRPCAIDGGRRYLVKGQTDLEATFTCIATVGTSGRMNLGEALTAAMQKPINDWGCNAGFLRRDALLMVTFVATNSDDPAFGSDGTVHEWAQAVRDAKLGDDRAVVMFNIFRTDPECHKLDRLCQLVKMFPFHLLEYIGVPDYGPAFAAAADLVEEACAGYVPPE